MNRSLVAYLLLSALWCSVASAHKDRIFPIDEHGNIEGIAEEYSPASIVVRRSGEQEPEVTLTLSGKTVHLPPCLARLFAMPAGQKLIATGSWWHDLSSEYSLPPYLVIAIPQKTHGLEGYDGYNLMFNLRTAELLEVRKQETHPDWSKNSEINLADLCTKAELGALPMWPARKLPEALWCPLEGVAYWGLGAIVLVLVFRAYRRRTK